MASRKRSSVHGTPCHQTLLAGKSLRDGGFYKWVIFQQASHFWPYGIQTSQGGLLMVIDQLPTGMHIQVCGGKFPNVWAIHLELSILTYTPRFQRCKNAQQDPSRFQECFSANEWSEVTWSNYWRQLGVTASHAAHVPMFQIYKGFCPSSLAKLVQISLYNNYGFCWWYIYS